MNKQLVDWILIIVGIWCILAELGLSTYLGTFIQPISTERATLNRVLFPLIWPSVIGVLFILIGIFLLVKKTIVRHSAPSEKIFN